MMSNLTSQDTVFTSLDATLLPKENAYFMSIKIVEHPVECPELKVTESVLAGITYSKNAKPLSKLYIQEP